jgi:hypothetical protein
MSPDDRIVAGRSALSSPEPSTTTIRAIRPPRRRAAFAALAATAFAFAFMTACSDAPVTAPATVAASQAHTSDLLPPSTSGEVVDLLVPFASSTQLNPCRMELVFLEGGQHAHFYIDTSTAGNIHVEIHYNTTGVKGYALTATGDSVRYNNAETADWVWNVAGPPPIEQTVTIDTHLIRQKEDAISSTIGDDFFYHQTMHFTVNAQGIPTATVTNVSADCR